MKTEKIIKNLISCILMFGILLTTAINSAASEEIHDYQHDAELLRIVNLVNASSENDTHYEC